MGATPTCPAVGVTVTVRLLSLPPKMILAFGTRPGFEEDAESVRLAAGNSASPTVKGTPLTDEFIRQVVTGIVEMTGAVFAGSTLTTNEALLDLPPVSMTQSVIVETPA